MEYKLKQQRGNACLECGDVITYGRRDRKFCSDQCKNKYHNDIEHRRRSVQVKVIKALNKNYRILDSLILEGYESADLVELSQIGFNKDYATSYQKRRGRNEYGCFDIRYCLTPTRLIHIQRVSTDEKFRIF